MMRKQHACYQKHVPVFPKWVRKEDKRVQIPLNLEIRWVGPALQTPVCVIKRGLCATCMCQPVARRPLLSHRFDRALPRGRMPIPNRLTVSGAGNPLPLHKKGRYDTAALQAREGAVGRHWCSKHFSLGKSLSEGEWLLLTVWRGRSGAKVMPICLTWRDELARMALVFRAGPRVQHTHMFASQKRNCGRLCWAHSALVFTCRPFLVHWRT